MKGRFGLALDLGTSYVTGGLFSFAEYGDKPYVHEVYRSLVDVGEEMTPERLTRLTLRSVREVYNQAIKKASRPPDEIIIGLSAPFYLPRTTKVSMSRERPETPITREEFRTLMEHGEKEVVASLKNQTAGKVEFFSRTPLKVFVNGYKVESPLGKTGHSLDMFIRYEAIHRDLKEKLRETFHAHHQEFQMRITSIPMASFFVLKHTVDTKLGLVFVDIGGEVTEISVICNNGLERVISMPSGSNTIVRKVAEITHNTFHDAVFLVHRWADKSLEEAVAQKVGPVIDEAVASWRVHLARELDYIFREGFSFSQIVFSGGGALLLRYKKEFPGLFRMPPSLKEVPVHVAEPHAVQGLFENPNYFIGAKDFNIASLMLFPFITHTYPEAINGKGMLSLEETRA